MGGWSCKENGGKILNIGINIKLKKNYSQNLTQQKELDD